MEVSDIPKNSGSLKTFQSLPKVHLHLHLEGAIRLRTILELYRREGDESLTLEEVTNKVRMKRNETSFGDFLGKFPFIFGCVNTKKDISRFTREVISDSEAEGVRYLELRFCPHSMESRTGISLSETFEGVLEGLHTAKTECNNLHTNIIAIIDQRRGTTAAKEAVYWAARFCNDGVTAIDIAGDPSEVPLIEYLEVCNIAREKGLGLTVHAGELQCAESVRIAVEKLGANRIGHGIRAIESPSVIDLLLRNQVVLEVCVTSNVYTKAATSLKSHPLPRLFDAGIRLTINSDDPLIFNTSLSKEYKIIQEAFGMTLTDFQTMNLNGIDAAFTNEKIRNEIRSIIIQGYASRESALH